MSQYVWNPIRSPNHSSRQRHLVLELIGRHWVEQRSAADANHFTCSKGRCARELWKVEEHLDPLSLGILGRRLQAHPRLPPHTWKPSEASLGQQI